MQKEFKNLLHSFTFAFRGLYYCIVNECNLRIHLVVASYVLYFSRFYEFTRGEFCILLLVIGLTICFEILNTSVESLINWMSPTYDQMARVAKDVAAGAVLVCVFTSVIVGLHLLWDIPTMLFVLDYITGSIWRILLLGISLVAAVLFSLWGPRGIRIRIGRMRSKTNQSE